MSKVLVVDDSLSVRKVVERALAARSIHVLTAATGAEAIEYIQQAQPDLVICDVLMPDKDGYQICEFVKTHPVLGRTPVLLISGIVNGSVLERAAKVRSDDVMRKPFAAEELLRKVDGLLAAGVNGGAGTQGPAVRERIEPDATPRPSATGGAALAPPGPREEATEPTITVDLKTCLGQFAAMPGVRLAVVVDREGFLVESAGELPETDLAWALASWLAESSDGIGRELSQGSLQAMILEYEGGVVLLHVVGSSAMLALLLRDATSLGKVRYSVKKAMPDLLRVI